jgi:hypothetical protein
MASKVRLSTNLAGDKNQLDFLVAVEVFVARERTHFENSVETMTGIVLEVEVAAAVVAGNLSNFDSLECEKSFKVINVSYF